MFDLRHIQALILDIDGILYEGEHARPGAIDLIRSLHEQDTPFVLLSNNTTRPLSDHVAKLARLGMPIAASSIVTAARVAANTIIRESAPGTRCLVIGEAGLVEAMEEAGFEVTQSDIRDVRYVVVGMDRQFTYEKLKLASQAIRNGAEFISSNPDPNYPNGDEIIPASGALQAAIEMSAGRKARVTGKPERPGFDLALGMLGTLPEHTGMLGDQLGTDILGARWIGVNAFLILSMLTPHFESEAAVVQPDAVFESTLDFYQQWAQR